MTRSTSRSAARLAAVQALYQQEMEGTPTTRLIHEFHAHRLGATIEEIAGATNWLRHTSRAALTRLRQRGFDIRSEQVDGRRVYRLHTAA